MKRKGPWLIILIVLMTIAIFNSSRLQLATIAAVQTADLYIKDTPMDTGVEPNPDAGPMWVSEDIWVRTTPDPAYQPYPFPEATPPWTPLPHENPEYRDPKYGLPNYVYVRVRNRGSVASNGTERLRLYWAKASTGLAWPTQWVDFLASNCGPTKLYGAEVTKPRQNAATATPAERAAYRQAILDLGTNPALVFPDRSYWHKQQEVHANIMGSYPYAHGSPAFLSWHREMVNRYEVLLQEANPTVKLLYWDWTTDPENSTGGFNFFTPSFMGASGRGTGGVSIGAPFMPALAPPTVTRNLSLGAPGSQADTTVLSSALYQNVRSVIENVPNHNSAHGYIGGGGDMSFPSSATRDPFFFLLHTNVDRLWAQWQRNPANLSRIDPATAYDGNSSNANITINMGPWDGTGGLRPWTVGDGYIVSKTSKHPTVVSPPIYDTAPLVVPALQPGQAVVIQIPWYPPSPADFACFGGDQGHFCLLGRIETSTSAPFGMTFPEGADVGTNTRNNNNIAWKNITVVDSFPGPGKLASILVRNPFRERVLMGLRFANTQDFGASFFDFGRILVDLKPELLKRWREGNRSGQGVRPLDNDPTERIQIASPEAFIQNLRLEPGETFSIDVYFELAKDYRPMRGVLPKWDLIQTGVPGNPAAIVGGQRFVADFQKLVLVKTGEQWRYLADASNPGPNWRVPDFDDTKWKLGQGELGFGDNPSTSIDGGPPDRRRITTYFRRAFEVADPGFFRSLLLRLKRDDGAVVYLNGTEIHRVNLPGGTLTTGTLATREVKGLEEEVFFPIPGKPELLRPGRNVVAVEVHQNSPRSEDLSFDLELSANPADTRFAPDVAINSPFDGSLWQTGQRIPVTVEALDSDGKITSVSLFADGKLIGTLQQPPFTFQWQGAARGVHRLRAVAQDSDQQRATSEITITVLDNTPPTVSLLQPANGASFPAGRTVVATAQASDSGGAVERVEFFVRDGNLFTAPDRLVGTARTAPYTVSIRGLAPGHYMLTAVARDNRGATSPSIPVHFGIQR